MCSPFLIRDTPEELLLDNVVALITYKMFIWVLCLWFVFGLGHIGWLRIDSCVWIGFC
jgi:hypothetical protein